MDHILELFHSEHDDDLLYVDLQMLQDWLVVSPPSKFYTASTVLFHKYGGANFSVTNCMSHFSMFVPTKATLKLANVNTGHSQVIGIILCLFPNCSGIYTVVPVYYCTGHPSNTISSGDLKFYVVFLKVTSELLEQCYSVDPWGDYLRSPYQNQNNLDCIQIEIVRVNPQINRNIVVPTFCDLYKKSSLRLFISSLVISLFPW